MSSAFEGITGDGWFMMACVDRLVELGEIREVSKPNCLGQCRIFIKDEQ